MSFSGYIEGGLNTLKLMKEKILFIFVLMLGLDLLFLMMLFESLVPLHTDLLLDVFSNQSLISFFALYSLFKMTYMFAVTVMIFMLVMIFQLLNFLFKEVVVGGSPSR